MNLLQKTNPKRLIYNSLNSITKVFSGIKELAGTKLVSLLLIAGGWLLADNSVTAQINSYRTKGNVTFASEINWEVFVGIWADAASPPTSAANVITIRNGHTAVVTAPVTLDQVVVDAGGVLTVNSGQTLTILDHATLDMNVAGTVNNAGTVTVNPGATITFLANSAYNHTQNGGSIPTATWNTSSNCNITGVTTAASLGGFGQTFGNLTWNCPGQISNFYIESNVTVAGNFTVSGTGTFDSNNHVLRMSNTATGYTITVDGDFIITNNSSFKMNNSTGSCILNVGGNFNLISGYCTIVTGGANSTLSVTGSVTISGGTLCFQEDPSLTTGVLNVGGNFTLSAGTITETGSGSGNINFNGGVIQVYTRTGGAISNQLNFSVLNGSVLDVGTSIIDGSTGTFTLNSGAGIITAHPQGLSTTAGTGSIRVAGAKLFDSGADYTYDGSAAQVTGNALPGTVQDLTFNNTAGVTLTNSVTINGTLTMMAGNISPNGNTFYLANNSPGSLSYTSGTILGRFRRAISSTGADYLFPLGTSSFYRPAIFNFATLGAATDISAEFIEANPGSFSPYLDDGSNQLDYAFTDGYWSFRSSTTPANSYSLSLTGDGFSSYIIDANSRISGRNNASPTWQDYGTHGSVAGNIITRTAITNLNTTSFDYCFAGRCTIAANAGTDVEICKGSSTMLNGSGGGTYSWSPSYGLSNPNIANPTANPEVTTTYTLTVTGGGCTKTDDVIVTVNPLPAITLGYAYQKTITIDHNQVSGGSDLYNFPVLVNISADNDLRTVANGGYVNNSNGYDIIFIDQDGNKLDHEIELYDGSTVGRLVAWVRIPVLSTSINTAFRMLYGNPQANTNLSTPNVWDSDFSGVWHLQNTNDATINGNNGSALGATALITGQIGNGYDLDGASGYIRIPDNPTLDLSTELTLSAWIRADAVGSWNRIVAKSHSVNNMPYTMYGLLFDNAQHTRLEFSQGATQRGLNGSTIIPVGQWRYVVATYDGSVRNLYVNGASAGTSNTVSGNFDQNNIPLAIGAGDYNGSPANFFNGIADEVRVLIKAKSADWILTEYNNQKPSSTFYTISGQASHSIYDFEVCENETGIIYSVPNQTGYSYDWTVTGEAGFTGDGTNQIVVSWGPAGTGQVSLSITNTSTSCSAASPVYTVIKNPNPAPVITGAAEVCPGATGVHYSTPDIVGHSYSWTITGASSYSGENTNEVIVNWPVNCNTTGAVRVTETIVSTGCSVTTSDYVITIRDIALPTFTRPVDVTIYTGADCSYDISVGSTGDVTDEWDNCSVGIQATYVDGAPVAIPGCEGGYTILRTWSLVDNCCNASADQVQTITIRDNTVPTFTVPSDIIICRSDDCSYDISIAATGDVTDESDNCSTGLEASYSDDSSGLVNCDQAGFILRTWTLTDNCNNTTAKIQTIWVEPSIKITAVNDTICNGDETNILITSGNTAKNGIRYTWTVTDNPKITGESSSTGQGQPIGTAIEQTLTNNSADTAIVRYRITPWTINDAGNNQCQGIPVVVEIWIEPEIDITAINDTICDGNNTNILVNSSNTTSNGIRFTWTVTDNPKITGESSSTGQGQSIGTSIVQSLTNNSNDTAIVRYRIIPWTIDNNGNNRCSGNPIEVAVWVEPTVSITAESDTICNGDETNILVSSDNTTSNGIRYTWTVIDNPKVTGESSSPGQGQLIGTPIVQALTNISMDTAIIRYRITPWTIDKNGSNQCSGNVIYAEIWVEPTITITAVNDTLCNGESTSILVESGNTASNGIRYTWTVKDNPKITGESNSTAYGQDEGTAIIQELINSSQDTAIVKYHIIPWTIDKDGNNHCAGIPIDISIWVEPTVTVTAVNDTICNGNETNILVESENTTSNGTRYTWTVADNPKVIGESGSTGQGQQVGTPIVQLLTNISQDTAVVRYHIVPWTIDQDGNNRCEGNPIDVDIWIEPTVIITAGNDTICNNSSTNIMVSSNNIVARGIRYTWTVTDNPKVTGESGSVGQGQEIDTPIVQNLINLSSDTAIVRYRITPWPIDNSGNNKCAGVPMIVDIWVEPTPTMYFIPAQDTICDNEVTDVELNTLARPTFPLRFDYTVAAEFPDSVQITNTQTDRTGYLEGEKILEQIDNLSNRAQKVTFTVTPYTVKQNGAVRCIGSPYTVDVWVEPTPTMYFAPIQDTICDFTITDIEFRSQTQPTLPLRIDYTVTAEFPDSVQITNTQADRTGYISGEKILEQIDNLSNRAQKVTFTATPYTVTQSGAVRCAGTQYSIDIWVEPTPIMSFVPVQDTICDNTITDVEIRSLTQPTLPVRFDYIVTAQFPDSVLITNTQPDRSGYLTGGKIFERIDNLSDRAQKVTFTVTPYTVTQSGAVRCTGTQNSIDIWVEPTPTMYFVPVLDEICDSTVTDIEMRSLTQPTLPVRFDYTVTAEFPDSVTISNTQTDRTGYLTGEKILELIDNLSDRPQKVTFTVMPYTVTLNGATRCTGSIYIAEAWVNPTPRAITYNIKPAICYAGYTQIVLTSPTIMTSGEIRFDYTISVPPGVAGNSNPGTDKLPGDDLSFKYSNLNDSVQSVYFSITPKVVGLSCPEGKTVIQEVHVHPKPARGITITKPFTCEASVGRASLRAVISRGAGPYHLLWTGPVGYVMEDSLEITNLYAGYYTLDVTDNLGCVSDTAINIVNLSASPRLIPLPVLPNIHVSCPGGNDGTVRIYVRNGITFPYTYWLVHNDVDTLFTGVFSGNYDPLNPSTFRVHTGLMAGQYKLIVHDINGCETSRTDELKEPEPITTTFDISDYSGSDISCRGYSDGTVTATVTGGNGSYTYYWYPETGSLTVSNTSSLLDSIPAGKYYLQVTDLLGCVKIDSVTLTDPPGMDLTSSEVSQSNDGDYQISCYGANDGYIKITVTGGSGNYTYSWVGPDGYTATTKDISGLKAGNYTCTVTDINGCILTPKPSFDLTQPDLLAVTSVSSTSIDGSYNINCYGGTGSVDVTVTGGSVDSYIYEWNTSNGAGIVNGQQDQNTLRAGTYHLVVTDENGCIAETDITLTQPQALVTELIPVHITCQTSGFDNGALNLNVTGGISPYSFNWSTGATTQNISGLTEGYYTVTVTDANGCVKIDSARVNLPPPLSYSNVISYYNGYNISCYGRADGSIEINPTSGTPPLIYSWQGPGGFISTSKDISGLGAGQYTLNITDSNMCTADTVFVLTEPGRLGMTIITSVSQSGDPDINVNCAGGKTGSINVEAVNNAGPVDYLWADGEIGNIRMDLMAGDYKVLITDSNGCSADSVITLTEPDSIKLSFSVTQPFCPDMPDGEILLTVTGGTNSGYTYLWSDNSTTQNITTAVSGIYSVTVTDANGCIVTGSVMMSPVNDICLSIPNAISPNGDLINDEWNIGLKELYPDMEVKIFNRWGELIWKSERGYPLPWDGRSKGEILPIDSYHYTIELHNGSKPIIGHVTIVK